MNRIRAASIHFVSSILVALAAGGLIFALWYPSPYVDVSGGLELFFLVVGVDVTLGPLLTFAVFNPAKGWKVLRRDLAVIVILQVAALAYGVHTMAIARPVVLALEGERFRVVIANAVVERELPMAPEDLRTLSWTGPRLVGTSQPAKEDVADAVMMGLAGADLGMRPRYWRHWSAADGRAAIAAGKPLSALLKDHPEKQAAVDTALAKAKRTQAQVLAVPVIARRLDWSVLVDKTTGEPVGFVPLDGF
jgi:hypothetical protein